MNSPTSIDQWAAIVADDQQPRADREQALAAMEPYHRQLAQRVRARLRAATADSEGELVSHVGMQLWQGRFDVTLGYEPWCYQVMRNHLVSELRKRQMPSDAGIESAAVKKEPLLRWEQEQDWRTPFGEEDLATVRDWAPQQRVLLLCRSLLWVKVPSVEWESWLHSIGVKPPFPEDEVAFVEQDSISRNRELAAVLGLPLGTFHTNWHRGVEALRCLRCVQELRHER